MLDPLIEEPVLKNGVWVPANSHADPIISDIHNGNVFDSHIITLIDGMISSDSIVIDVGANFGQMSVHWAAIAKEVHSIEANPYIAHFLKKTASEHTNMIVHENAAWNVSNNTIEMLEFNGSGPALFMSGMSVKGPGDERVDCLSYGVNTKAIDDIEFNGPVSVIKMDIQGSEIFALRGAKETIIRHKPIILFEYEEEYDKRLGTSFKEYEDFFESINYIKSSEMSTHHDFVYKPKP